MWAVADKECDFGTDRFFEMIQPKIMRDTERERERDRQEERKREREREKVKKMKL